MQEFAEIFAKEWISAWNAHDLDKILSHYDDNFEMSSPFISLFDNTSNGTLHGKQNVAAYWSAALNKFNDLHFEILGIFVGANSIAIYYKSVLDKKAIETFFFNDNKKVIRAFAHYD